MAASGCTIIEPIPSRCPWGAKREKTEDLKIGAVVVMVNPELTPGAPSRFADQG